MGWCKSLGLLKSFFFFFGICISDIWGQYLAFPPPLPLTPQYSPWGMVDGCGLWIVFPGCSLGLEIHFWRTWITDCYDFFVYWSSRKYPLLTAVHWLCLPKFICWTLMRKVMALGRGAFERWLGPEGAYSQLWLAPLWEKPMKGPCSFYPVRTHRSRYFFPNVHTTFL